MGIIYPGPSPFARNRTPPPIPRNVPPAFIACAGSGDRVHAVWAIEYFSAMLAISVPNIEMHMYGNGRHPGDALPDGSHQTVNIEVVHSPQFGYAVNAVDADNPHVTATCNGNAPEVRASTVSTVWLMPLCSVSGMVAGPVDDRRTGPIRSRRHSRRTHQH